MLALPAMRRIHPSTIGCAGTTSFRLRLLNARFSLCSRRTTWMRGPDTRTRPPASSPSNACRCDAAQAPTRSAALPAPGRHQRLVSHARLHRHHRLPTPPRWPRWARCLPSGATSALAGPTTSGRSSNHGNAPVGSTTSYRSRLTELGTGPVADLEAIKLARTPSDPRRDRCSARGHGHDASPARSADTAGTSRDSGRTRRRRSSPRSSAQPANSTSPDASSPSSSPTDRPPRAPRTRTDRRGARDRTARRRSTITSHPKGQVHTLPLKRPLHERRRHHSHRTPPETPRPSAGDAPGERQRTTSQVRQKAYASPIVPRPARAGHTSSSASSSRTGTPL
jgi:hypothetical protein